jgi:hypothetical protein
MSAHRTAESPDGWCSFGEPMAPPVGIALLGAVEVIRAAAALGKAQG